MKMAIAAAILMLLGTKAHAQSSYGPYPEQTYITCGSASAKFAVVLIHGGAWVGGDDAMAPVALICKFLGSHGVQVMSINYRLSLAAPWPAQLQDAQLGLRWLRANSPAKRIGVIGLSAGGHIALSMALATATMNFAATDPLNESALLNTETDLPDFVVDASGPTDLTDTTLLPYNVPTLLQGLTMQPGIARAFASPIAHIHGGLPAILISHGTSDLVVPTAQSDEFVTAALSAGIPVQVADCGSGSAVAALSGITYDRHAGGHVFSGLGPTRSTLFREINQFVHGSQPTTPISTPAPQNGP